MQMAKRVCHHSITFVIAGYMRRFGGFGLGYYIFTPAISLSRASLQPCRGENQIPCVKDSIPLCGIGNVGLWIGYVLRLDRIRAEAGSNTIRLDRIPFGWIGYQCVDQIWRFQIRSSSLLPLLGLLMLDIYIYIYIYIYFFFLFFFFSFFSFFFFLLIFFSFICCV